MSKARVQKQYVFCFVWILCNINRLNQVSLSWENNDKINAILDCPTNLHSICVSVSSIDWSMSIVRCIYFIIYTTMCAIYIRNGKWLFPISIDVFSDLNHFQAWTLAVQLTLSLSLSALQSNSMQCRWNEWSSHCYR